MLDRGKHEFEIFATLLSDENHREGRESAMTMTLSEHGQLQAIQ